MVDRAHDGPDARATPAVRPSGARPLQCLGLEGGLHTQPCSIRRRIGSPLWGSSAGWRYPVSQNGMSNESHDRVVQADGERATRYCCFSKVIRRERSPALAGKFKVWT